MKKALATSLAGAAMVLANTVHAQEPGTTFSNGGTFVLSVERIAGLAFTSSTLTSDDGSQEVETTSTEFSLGPDVFIYSLNPFVMTQLGFDFFVIDRLSIGAGLAYWHASGEQESTGEPADDLSDITLFRFLPRVGYGMMFNDVIGIWARGGVGYYSFSSDGETSETSDSGWSFGAEGLLVISPANHFAIELGPAVDIGFAGERESDPVNPASPTVTNDTSYRHFGIVVGITGWF
jgi:hypothetical protein